MDTYSILRQIADSRGLLAMVLIFVGIVIYAFRRGSKKVQDDSAQIPFRNDRPGE